MQDRDYPPGQTDQTEHERRVAREEGEREGAVADPIAGADRRPSSEEDLAADRDERPEGEELRP